MKIIYEISKEDYDELSKEEWYGCENDEQYIKELLIEDADKIYDADLEIIIK